MQTLALLIDSWRLLTNRKLFWVTLALNLLVVLIYGSIAITPTGVSIGFGLWEWESEQFRAGSPLARTVLMPFINMQIISIWLAWIATGLGLISTASIFPDFLADGAIDMVLAKPISRLKTFLVKYLGALLFVLMQVSVFCVASLIVGRIRLGEWQWTLLAAIPVVVVFFSYIYSVSALVGVATRSSIAAILAAAVFWLAIFAVQSAEQISLTIASQLESRADMREQLVEKRKANLDALAAKGKDRSDNEFERIRGRLENDRLELEKERESAAKASAWHQAFYAATVAVPKTKGTIGLIDRWFASETDATTLSEVIMSGGRRRGPAMRDGLPENEDDFDWAASREGELRATRRTAEVSVAWVIGTSLAFEAFVLGIAALIFVRRDF